MLLHALSFFVTLVRLRYACMMLLKINRWQGGGCMGSIRLLGNLNELSWYVDIRLTWNIFLGTCARIGFHQNENIGTKDVNPCARSGIWGEHKITFASSTICRRRDGAGCCNHSPNVHKKPAILRTVSWCWSSFWSIFIGITTKGVKPKTIVNAYYFAIVLGSLFIKR